MAETKGYYLTTAIFYPSAAPALHSMFEAIGADAIARYQRLMGRETRFLTGMDEHSANVERVNRLSEGALGSVEISLSRHCPLWYGYSGRLKCLERLAYINTTIYPLTSLPLVAYCVLPAVCLLTGKFIIPTVSATRLTLQRQSGTVYTGT